MTGIFTYLKKPTDEEMYDTHGKTYGPISLYARSYNAENVDNPENTETTDNYRTYSLNPFTGIFTFFRKPIKTEIDDFHGKNPPISLYGRSKFTMNKLAKFFNPFEKFEFYY